MKLWTTLAIGLFLTACVSARNTTIDGSTDASFEHSLELLKRGLTYAERQQLISALVEISMSEQINPDQNGVDRSNGIVAININMAKDAVNGLSFEQIVSLADGISNVSESPN